MLLAEFEQILDALRRNQPTTTPIDVRPAPHGVPNALHTTLSSFSNLNEGGAVIFGVDPHNGYAEVGVKDAERLETQMLVQCLEMTPTVRPFFSVFDRDGKTIVVAEIPGLSYGERPCFQQSLGPVSGAFVRVDDQDLPMSETERRSYEVFQTRTQDELCPATQATMQDLDPNLWTLFVLKFRIERRATRQLDEAELLEHLGFVADARPTVAALLLFGTRPQAFLPAFSIHAECMEDVETPNLAPERIEGRLPDMVDAAVEFVARHTCTETVLDRDGQRMDVKDYPEVAVREAILNAVIHRDYGLLPDAKPIELKLHPDRLEITSPGGLFGETSLESALRSSCVKRNPLIAETMAFLQGRLHRRNGILTIRKACEAQGLPEPTFTYERDVFRVTLWKAVGARQGTPAI